MFKRLILSLFICLLVHKHGIPELNKYIVLMEIANNHVSVYLTLYLNPLKLADTSL